MKRRKPADIALPIAQLAALLAFVVIFVPSFRPTVVGLGVILVVVAILVGIVAFGLFLIRLNENHSMSGTSLPENLEPVESIPYSNPKKKPQTTADLIQQLRAMDWFQFEKLIALVYQRHGYVVTRRGGANPDGGIDLVIDKDGQRSAIQCKQWKTWNVGVRAVREFLGALTDAGIANGTFVTLCGYTADAKQLAEKHRIEILNEAGLVKMMKDINLQFDPETLAILHDTRKFCAKCEREMVLRTARNGRDAGRQFWGCSAYPRCRFTMPRG